MQLKERLRHVYWIGGASGGGKSTMARRLATRHGLTLYATDDAMGDHAGRTTPEDSPFLTEFKAMTMDERWATRSPETMLDTFHWYRGEGFDPIVDDLLRLPSKPGVVVEGFRLLPHLVQPLLTAEGQAVWLLPTPDFRRAAFDSRGSTWQIAGQTSNPERALHNLLERDRMFTERLAAETDRLGLPTVQVEVGMTEDDLAAQVEWLLGLPVEPQDSPAVRS
jgi:2-phosphoglycerate kinase